jgi:chorismate synthase
MWLAGNSLGKEFVFTSFGESHGKLVGAVVDGCPAGLPFSEADVQGELDRRVPQQRPELFSSRVEKDVVQIHSGVFNGFATGAPISMTVENKENLSSDYETIRDTPRPSHADFTARVKYGGFNDHRGGGRFSGRLTVATIMAGALAKKLLSNFDVDVLAYAKSIGKVKMSSRLDFEEIRKRRYESPVRCPESGCSEQMQAAILEARKEGESLGGTIDCLVLNLPAGVGAPLFDSLDGDLAKAVFSVPAVKGVEFGAGFSLSAMKGSKANDAFRMSNGKVVSHTNLAGGVLGGISSGMPIIIRIGFKPTPSIEKDQLTVDLSKMENTGIRIGGRHDPCVVPKAVPVVEAVVALILADHMIRSGFIPKVLKR